jgi:hypothetical protein
VLAGEALGLSGIDLELLRVPLQEEDPRRRREKPQPQPWDHGPLLPVRIVLRDFAARGLPKPGQQFGSGLGLYGEKTGGVQAEVHGSGAIAQDKSVAAGAGGIAAGRDVRKGP